MGTPLVPLPPGTTRQDLLDQIAYLRSIGAAGRHALVNAEARLAILDSGAPPHDTYVVIQKDGAQVAGNLATGENVTLGQESEVAERGMAPDVGVGVAGLVLLAGIATFALLIGRGRS